MPNVNFTSKGFKDLESQHLELNTFIKFSVIAVDHLKNQDISEDELKDLIAGLIKGAGERWVATRYSNPISKLDMVRLRLTKSGIMWVYSAFDVFLNYTHSYCSERIEPSGTLETEDKTEKIKIEQLFNKYNWNLNQLNFLMPLLNFYIESRHCIVHNMAKASKKLRDILESQEFALAIENWPTVKPERSLSPAPIILEDGQILFNPHHAITFSDICLRIARIADLNIFNELKDAHFVIECAEKRLIKPNQFYGPHCKDVYAYLKCQLWDEYHIHTIHNMDIKKILEDSGDLEIYKRKYNSLKSTLILDK